MDLHDQMSQYVKERNVEAEESFKSGSRERLQRIIERKIRTSFIGALSRVEQHFGHLWGHDSRVSLTPDQEKYRNIYDLLRNEILNNGNNQIRAIINELSQYTIEWDRYQYQLNVKGGNDV